LSHESVLRNLAHGRETVNPGLGRKSGSARSRGSSIPVHRLGEDARPLTGEEYRLYSGMISEMRQTDRSGRHRDRLTVSSVAPTQVLVRPDRLRPAPVIPLPTSLVSLPATVPDQTEVLDLSSSSRRPPDQTDQTAPAPVPPPAYLGAGVNTTPAHSRRDRHDTDTSSPLSLVGALRRLGTNVNLVPVNFSMTSRSRSHSPSTVTVTRAETETRHRDRSNSPSVVTVSHRWSHSRSHRDRDRSVPSERERHRHERHHRTTSSSSSSSAVIERLGAPSTSSSSRHSQGVAMPLAEATRLLTNTWDNESVRQADMFINSLTPAATTTTAAPSVIRQLSSPAAVATPTTSAATSASSATSEQTSSEYYNPAMPTDDSTDSSDSNNPNT